MRFTSKIPLGRLSENAHLLRYAHPSSLRRTPMYASFLGISQALYLGIFRQPLDGSYELRESPVSYKDILGHENEDLRLENAYAWDNPD